MNTKFKELLDPIAWFTPKTNNSKKAEERAKAAAEQLGMNVIPFVYEEPQTKPEREIDFLIENKKAYEIKQYLAAGYKLNKRELFKIFSNDFLAGWMCEGYSDKQDMIKNYGEPLKEMIKEALFWSDKVDAPDKETLELASLAPEGRNFLNKKQKGYWFLYYAWNKLSDVYDCSLDEFHKRQELLKKTEETVPEVLKYVCEALKKRHTQLYDKIAQQNKDNLKGFIGTAEILNKESALSKKIKTNNPYQLGRSADLEKLPPEAQTLVKSISQTLELANGFVANQTTVSSLATDSSNEITTEQKFFLQKTIQTDVPKMIGEYLALSPNEKEKFQSNNQKSVDSLLVEALKSVEQNVQNIVGEHLERAGIQKIKSLQVSHQYLTSKKV